MDRCLVTTPFRLTLILMTFTHNSLRGSQIKWNSSCLKVVQYLKKTIHFINPLIGEPLEICVDTSNCTYLKPNLKQFLPWVISDFFSASQMKYDEHYAGKKALTNS
jgi:hypothetical protein